MSRELTTEERAATKEALKDTEGEEVVLAKIAAMSDSDRALTPRTWSGRPAYARGGRIAALVEQAVSS